MTVPTYKPKVWAEIWRRPGHATFQKQIDDPLVGRGSVTARANGVGEGTLELASNYSRLDEILKPDPTTPANAVSSLTRIFQEGVTGPIAEWLPAEMTGADSKTDTTVTVKGADIFAILGYARVEAWDWTGIDDEISKWPDWIWGGRNILGELESAYLPAVTRLHRESTVSAGTFIVGVSFNGGAIQNTSALAFNITAAAMRTALIALSNVDTIEVSGSGAATDPWRIQTITPEGEYVFSVNSGGLTGGLVLQDRETIGAIVPAGWTTSFNPVNNLSHGPVSVFRATTFTGSDPAAPACDTAGVGIAFDGDVGQFPGIQKIVAVKPGGRYYAKVTAYAQGAAGTYRLVLRDLYENGIAVDPSFDSGTTLVANTWTTFTIPLVAIPTDVDRIIFRFASVGTGNPPLTFVACMELREGMPPTTWGDIWEQLFADATTDHAGRRCWQIGATAASYLSLDFTDLVDSAGAAWTHPEVKITLKRGQNYLRVAQECFKQGYEGRIVPNNYVTGTWKFQLYNPGTAGTVLNASNSPVIMGGRDVSKRDVRKFLPTFTDWAVEAGGQAIARERSATAVTALGRIEGYTPNQDLGSLTEAGQAAATALATGLASSQSLTYTVVGVIGAYPLVDYKVFDTINIDDPPDVLKTSRRIRQIQLAWDKTGAEYTIQLGAESYVGVGAIYEGVNRLLTEFKAIRDRPDETTDALNYFPAGGTGTPTVVIAAYNATELSKGKADFICTGTSDEGVFNLALGILSASLNTLTTKISGRIVLTEGDFYFGTTIDLHIGVRFEGMGRAATFLHSKFSAASSTATNCTMFTIDESATTGANMPISFSHMDLDGHKAIQSAGSPVGIYCEPNGAETVTLTDVAVHSFRGHGVHFDRSARTVYIERCRLYSNTGAGLAIGREGIFHVTNNEIFSNTSHGIDAPGAIINLSGNHIFSNTLDGFSGGGILQQPGQIFQGNHIYGNRTGIVIDGYEVVINGNFVYSNTAGGIDAYGNKPMTIVGNEVYSNGTFGIQLNGGADNRGGVCVGNNVELNGTHGINVNGHDWHVADNLVNNNSRTTTNTSDGIRVTSGTNVSIHNNKVRQTTGAPVQKYGINITAGAAGCWRAGNDCRGGGFGTAAYVDAGTASILVWAGGAGDNQ